MVYYFAYGSNMNPDRMKYRGIIWYDSYPGLLENYELVFNKASTRSENIQSFANIKVKNNFFVEGVIYLIDEKYLKVLDKFEGTNKKTPDYLRIKLDIIKDKTEIVPAWMYIANTLLIKEGLKPSKEYMNNLLINKDNLSKDYISKLENIQTLD